MSIRKCPNCGLPVGNLSVCPACGKQVKEEPENSESKESYKGKVKTLLNIGNVRLGIWDVLFLIVCNISVVLVIVNVAVGGMYWSPYPVLALNLIYFISFALASKSFKKFLTRYRNAVFILNALAAIFRLAALAFSGQSVAWLFDYFVPVNLIVACITLTSIAAARNVSMRSVLFSFVILFPQSAVQFILALLKVTAESKLALVLICIAFGLNLVSIINFIIIYLAKYRNRVFETFRLWE